MKKEAAFTGLEAAIVLIAFVVVAAVFSYVMLGAGFFATQKSQEVTYSGVKQATSNVVLDGQLYGDAATLTKLTFYVRVPEGGEAVKMKDITFLYGINNAVATKATTGTTYDAESLSPGERTKVELTVTGPAAGCKFTLEIKPSVGASTLVQRTLASGYTGGVII
ncbi:flagellin [Methanospirillum purgamenti]|nr:MULTISPECIES: flagellin [Methanospirillum]MDX8551863.1 flagellin [Methanospirillum hungatei]